ncbi:achaete-scute homolog 2-like [Galendromus occidentalis]|uniref:Achaete-scute homolog 2-like n=1 Tax=Galendromus occidentalis TaxID=34638 RepID=A0AAJ7L8D3_9ACAR|nr:achaete-scute homolog 2-like [Galendromus occidentalis]
MDDSLFDVNAAMNGISSHFNTAGMTAAGNSMHHHVETPRGRNSLRRYANVPPGYTDTVLRRNERERNRVRQVNHGFVVLRQKIPIEKGNKKMSKVETLRLAAKYIRQLQCVIQSADQMTRQPVGPPAEFSSSNSFPSSTLQSSVYESPTTSPSTFSLSPTTSPQSPHSLNTSNDAMPSVPVYQQDWFHF